MDDERLVREIMRRQLAICGYEVTAAVHGEEAVNAYRQALEAGRPFDAVILDLLVAAGWGGERTLVELLRLDPGVKALVCSGSLSGPEAHYREEGVPRRASANRTRLTDLRVECGGGAPVAGLRVSAPRAGRETGTAPWCTPKLSDHADADRSIPFSSAWRRANRSKEGASGEFACTFPGCEKPFLDLSTRNG